MKIETSNEIINGKPFDIFLKDIFNKHGIDYKNKHENVVITWGWHKGYYYRLLGYEVLVFECGYVGNRTNNWFSIGWNNLNNRADFKLPKDFVSTGRFNNFFHLKDWKNGGDKIIIAGQFIEDMSVQGLNLSPFYEKLYTLLSKKYNLPVYFKQKPLKKSVRTNFTHNIPIFQGDMKKALEEAAFIVTFNSNSAVDAVINGVPAITFDKGSMAWDVTSHDISEIIKPDRSLWAEKLAHCQWSIEEIENGDWLERLCLN